jgi:hypothetical protein
VEREGERRTLRAEITESLKIKIRILKCLINAILPLYKKHHMGGEDKEELWRG